MRLLVVVMLVLALGACKPKAPPKPAIGPLCFVETMTQYEAEENVRALKPEAWFALVLRDYDLWTGAVKRPVRDCSGQEVRAPELLGECVETEAPIKMKPPHALTKEDLVVTKGPGNQWIVWIQVEHLEDGEAIGPVALAAFSHKGASVNALGSLRAKRRRARLRLEKVGKTPVLVAEGDCEKDDPSRCKSAIRVLPLRNDYFLNEPLTLAAGEAEGQCLGPAAFVTQRTERVDLDSGWERRFEQTSSLTFETEQMTLHEQVVASDAAPRQPGVPPRLFRKADAERTIKIAPKRLAVSGPSLWVGMLRAAGALKKKEGRHEVIERGNLPPVKVNVPGG